jgi:hypothetical protein
MVWIYLMVESKVLEDENGELLIEIPDVLMNQMGWDFGTELEWIVEDGKVLLKEAKDDENI